MSGELGPLHPALHQIEKQVEDVRRAINEEVDRFAQSAKNDLTRARDYETALNKSLNAQKRQSVDLSQASVRLRELERDVDASRDIYQSFLKRSRETEEQESLNTSSARIIGEATVPQRRMFPPAMTLVAALGFLFGVLGAAAWIVAMARLRSEASEPRPNGSETRAPAPSSKPPISQPTRRPATIALNEKPLIARLRESDVMRTLSGILASGGIPDVTRWGWPTLRAGVPQTEFLDAMREVRAMVARRSPANATPVMTVISAGTGEDRGIAALNIALAAARDGARVLLVDADHAQHVLSNKLQGFMQGHVQGFGKSQLNRLGWLNIGAKVSPAIQTANGIAVRPASKGADAIRDAVAEARSAGSYDLVILDGPAMPWSTADHALLDMADGLVAILPASLDVNECMEDIITALGDTERKLAGVVLSELQPTVTHRQRDKQYA
jgi:Mrp family chromosome partitioning ATPase